MQRNAFLTLLAAAVVLGVAACSDSSTAPVSTQLTDQVVTADVAQASGDAIALDVQNLIGTELQFALPGSAPNFSLFGGPGDPTMPPGMTVTRSRTCYDATGAVQTQCDPLTTDSMRVQAAMSGAFTRAFTRPDGTTDSMSASVHRTRQLTISGLLGQETFRIHNAAGTSNDTTLFKGPERSRKVEESALDSAINVRFDLPRATNPWPVSGSMVRRVTGTITLTGPNGTETRNISRRVEVTFPTDTQGNVTIHVNDKTCTLNLVTHRVVNCN